MPSRLDERHTINQDGDRLVLLGTQGGPFIRSYKQTPSANLIVYKDMPFVIDTGYGTTFKLKEAGVNLAKLKYIFITHLHSDHYLDLGPLLYNAWISGLSEQIHVYAPAGVKSLIRSYWKSNEYDINTRIKDEGRPDIRNLVITHLNTEGVMLSNSDFEVSAIKNIHPPVDESYAFKFKVGQTIIVFSGDTAYCPPLAAFASGADYLVHEVMYTPAVEEMVKKRPNATKLKTSILSHHTSAEDVGKIAQQANVKNLILNHFVPPDDKALTDGVWIDAVQSTFSGKVHIGRDLQQFVL
jgi:ribonuclease BN (tRNA processing enzyme)